MEYLEKLLAAAKALKPEEMSAEIAPKGEVQKRERLLGTVPEEVQRFYYLYHKRAKAANVRIAEINQESDTLRAAGTLTSAKRREFREESDRLTHQCNRINEMFWEGVREMVSGAGNAENMALRKDWQVVDQPPKPKMPRGLELMLPGLLLGSILSGCEDPDCPLCRHNASEGDSATSETPAPANVGATAEEPAVTDPGPDDAPSNQA